MNPLGRRIVQHLQTNGAPLDDEELATALRVRRQVVNQECRTLERDGLLIRGVVMGNRVVNALREEQPKPFRPAPRAPVERPGSDSVELEKEAEETEAAAPPPPEEQPDLARIISGTEAAFQGHARRVLSARWGTALSRRDVALPGGVTQSMGLVSGNGRVVGDVVWLEGLPSAEAKASVVAEHVWLIGHVNAQRRFLVFGHDWDVLSRWLSHYRPLLSGIELWYLDGDRLERLA